MYGGWGGGRTRLAVDGDVGVVKLPAPAVLDKRKVVLVDGRKASVRQFDMPVDTFHIYYVYVVTLLVEEGVQSLP